jgi:4-amino-4-deoxy-L-arabinose transferase-like glycosyltransferase
MLSAPTKRTITTVLRSPALAVAAAYTLRMVLLWLSHRGEDILYPRFGAVGLETQLVALSLAAGKGFFGPYRRYEAPTACIAPVYPFLLAIGDKLFHFTLYGSTVFGQLMNCLFSAATCWPIFSIAKKVFSRRIGLASAWLWAFFPYAVLLPLEWTWDQSLSALLLALIVCVTFKLRESASSLALTSYGLLWALAALVNPTLCLLLPFLLIWLMVQPGPSRRLSLASAARIVVFFVLALLPWTIRNYYTLDGFVFVKSNFGMEFWLGNNPAVKEIYSAQRHPADNQGELISLILSGEPNYNREKEHEAIVYIEKRPGVFFKNVADRFDDTWAATYDSRVEPWILTLGLSRADVWFCLIFSVVSLAGMILALVTHWQDALPLAMCLVLFPIPYYITHTALRYRHPIDPFITILAVYAIARLWRALTASRDRSPVHEETAFGCGRDEKSPLTAML